MNNDTLKFSQKSIKFRIFTVAIDERDNGILQNILNKIPRYYPIFLYFYSFAK
jgi:hypothetical protein